MTDPSPLNKRLLNLRFRLEAAAEDCLQRNDSDGFSWLSDGVEALTQATDLIGDWAEWWSNKKCPDDEGRYLDQLIKRTIRAQP